MQKTTNFKHVCTLPIKDNSGLPKLPPNASWLQKLRRKIRMLLLLNPNHFKCSLLFRNKSSMLEERRKHASGRYSWVIHPLSTLGLIVEALFFIMWFFAILTRPMLLFSDSPEGIFGPLHYHFITPVQLLLIVTLFNIGYVEQKTQDIIVKPKKIILRYLLTFFVFDVTSCYLLQIIHFFTRLGYIKCLRIHTKESNCFEMVMFVSIASCCTRIYTLLGFMNDILATFKINKLLRVSLIYVIKTFIYLHLFAFMLFYVPYVIHKGDWPKLSWLRQANVKHHDPLYYQYFECFLMALCYFFGISYRYHIHLMEEQICLSVVMVFGRLYTLYLLADVMDLFGIVGMSESLYERQISLMKQYMTATNVPLPLRRRIFKFYEFKFQRRYFKENMIVNTLSEHLRTELFLFSARGMIQKVEFFKKLPPIVTGAIVAAMSSEIFSPKDIIIKQGSRDDTIFFISTGTVCIISKAGNELCHLDDGEVFGTPRFMYKEHPFTVTAVETTEVFTINKNQLLSFLGPYPEVLHSFYQAMKKRLAKFKEIDAKLTSRSIDLIHELRSGLILEDRSRRLHEK